MTKKQPRITKEKIRAQLDSLYETKFIDNLLETPEVRVFLFGGPLRDIVMGKPWKEADIRLVVSKPDIVDREKIVEESLKKSGITIKERVRIEKIGLTVYVFLPKESKTIYDVDLSVMSRLDVSSSDFIMNSMFFDLKTGELIDKYNAAKDIKSKILRTVKKPKTEFTNNPIAMFRAMRQACQHGLRIEEKTKHALGVCAKHVVVPLRHITDVRTDFWTEYYLANILKGFSYGARKYFGLFLETNIYYEMEKFFAEKLHLPVPTEKVKNPFLTKQKDISLEDAVSVFLSLLAKRIAPKSAEATFKKIKQLLTLNAKKKYKELVLDQTKIIFTPL